MSAMVDDEEFQGPMRGGPPPRREAMREPPREAARASAGRGKSKTAVFRKQQFTQHRSNTMRAGAVLLFIISVTGAVLWGGGGVKAWIALTPNWGWAGVSLALQVLLSWLQLTSCDRPKSFQYVISLMASTGMTIAGYLPMIYLGLEALAVKETWAWVVVTITTVVVAALADVVPEHVLVEG